MPNLQKNLENLEDKKVEISMHTSMCSWRVCLLLIHIQRKLLNRNTLHNKILRAEICSLTIKIG